MYRNKRSNDGFDVQHWLSVAGRRGIGTLLLICSIGVSSCQALNAVDDSLMNQLEKTWQEQKERP